MGYMTDTNGKLTRKNLYEEEVKKVIKWAKKEWEMNKVYSPSGARLYCSFPHSLHLYIKYLEEKVANNGKM